MQNKIRPSETARVMNTENQYQHTNGDSFTLSKTPKRTKRVMSTSIASTSGKIIEPLQPNQAKIIGPAQMAPRNAGANDLEKSTRTRSDYKKLRTADSKSSSEHKAFSGDNPPRTDNLSQVLIQALQNSDKKMLDTVLCAKDDKIVSNTVGSLPIELIDPFLRELQKCLYYKGEQTITYMAWLEKLIQTKLSFILTLPNLESDLAPLLELLNARTDVLDRMLRLKGRLSLMMSRVSQKEEKLLKHEPLLRYEESSSSDEETSSDDDAPIVESDEMEDSDDNSNNSNQSDNEESSEELKNARESDSS